MTWGSHKLEFGYDAQGRPFCCSYDGNNYYYVLNLQGDVVRIVNYQGIARAEYSYNAWGGITSATGTLANINPLLANIKYLWLKGKQKLERQRQMGENEESEPVIPIYAAYDAGSQYYFYPVGEEGAGIDICTIFLQSCFLCIQNQESSENQIIRKGPALFYLNEAFCACKITKARI